jgi:threonylcarbamoyladenosine tRNA methylthiotransferase MtaB
MRIAFTTFGCKINQYETDQMRQSLAGAGTAFVPFDGDADVYVINTCSVTSKSDYQCRQAIRAAVRRNPSSRVIVTGCYAETRPEEIRAIPGVTAVLGNKEKGSIVRYLPFPGGEGTEYSLPVSPDPGRRTRRVLKVQDGCDSNCSYCIIPRARGASRSIPREEIVAAFQRFVDEGVPEVVLSGIHIGRYGTDLAPRETLDGLPRELLSRRRKTRIRLSSIEPREVTSELIGFLSRGLCRHLHIPLQSGDDEILRSMHRDYTAGFYRDLVTSIAHAVPGIAIGADVMVGFPGEEDRHFNNTLKLIDDLPLTHVHVFSYSARPGTPAASFRGQISEQAKKERNEAIRSLGLRKNIAFRRSFIGAYLEVVVEDRVIEKSYVGLTDNYLKVAVRGAGREHISSLVRVNVQDSGEKGMIGIIADKLLI